MTLFQRKILILQKLAFCLIYFSKSKEHAGPFCLNPRMYKQIHTPTIVQGEEGWMEPLPGVFNMLQYFETIYL